MNCKPWTIKLRLNPNIDFGEGFASIVQNEDNNLMKRMEIGGRGSSISCLPHEDAEISLVINQNMILSGINLNMILT